MVKSIDALKFVKIEKNIFKAATVDTWATLKELNTKQDYISMQQILK